MKGRKRKPVATRKLEGNRSRRPIPKEPEYPKKLPAPPKWVKGEALKEWKRLAPMLSEQGVITAADWGMLATYCESWAQTAKLIEAREKMERAGLTGQPPYLSMLREIDRVRKQWYKAATELGLSPVTRSKVALQEKKQEADPVTQFEGRRLKAIPGGRK